MENRRLFQYLMVSVAVFFVYSALYNWFFPAPKPQTPTSQSASTSMTEATAAPSTSAASGSSASQATSAPGVLQMSATAELRRFSIGGSERDALQLDLTSRGAGVERLLLTSRKSDKHGTYVYRQSATNNHPLALLEKPPLADFDQEAFGTHALRIRSGDKSDELPLDRGNWKLETQEARRAMFTTRLESADGAELAQVSKEYRIVEGAPFVEMRITVENKSAVPLECSIIQDGPLGFPEEGRYYPSRRAHALWFGAAAAVDHKHLSWHELKGESRSMSGAAGAKFAWLASVNKYFGVFMRPISVGGANPSFVQAITARPGIPGPLEGQGDTLLRMETTSEAIQPGLKREVAFEIYAGSKNTEDLRSANAGFIDRTTIGYVAAQDFDRGCCPCQFEWLTNLMVWLLDVTYGIFGNYGIAILVLVIVVRACLHPLTVWQQKSMYRMQDSMVRIQPKLDAIKEKFPNDRQKQAAEQMRIYGEEGVNPAAPLVGMIPMFIQMPILIGLWTAMNTDVHLRHAPFDGWWIRDLSSPDALVTFAAPVTIPILGWLPMIGKAFADIPSINLLPVLMGVSMYLQQKYMPKPALAAKKDAIQNAPKPAEGALSAEEQLRQQQMIANMMSVLFPIMFYYQPSGLAVYWMFTNVFGICESLIIRRQLAAEKARRAASGPAPVVQKKPGVVSNFMKRLAEQAEGLQKRADELTREEEQRRQQRERDKRKGKL